MSKELKIYSKMREYYKQMREKNMKQPKLGLFLGGLYLRILRKIKEIPSTAKEVYYARSNARHLRDTLELSRSYKAKINDLWMENYHLMMDNRELSKPMDIPAYAPYAVNVDVGHEPFRRAHIKLEPLRRTWDLSVMWGDEEFPRFLAEQTTKEMVTILGNHIYAEICKGFNIPPERAKQRPNYSDEYYWHVSHKYT